MNGNTSGPNSEIESEIELQLSPRLVVVAVALAGLLAVLASDNHIAPAARFNLLVFAVFCYICAGITWLLNERQPRAGRWFAGFTLVAIIVLGLTWLDSTAFLCLLPLPVVAAMALAGFGAACVTALIETILLLWLARSGSPITPFTVRWLGVLGIWTVFGILLLHYRLLSQITYWSWQSYNRIQTLLDEARDRKLELEQLLDALVHANRQLDLLNERLAATRLLAEEAHKSKASFVAKVSHEFRTPLNMIIGLTDLLVETPDLYGDMLPRPLLEDIKIVHRNCAHLASMINDVLDLSQTEAGRLSLRKEWVDLPHDIHAAIEVVQPLIQKKKLGLELHVADTLPDVYCDRTRIRQVILNLVSNAARYTDHGALCVEATAADHCVIVSVADTGPGIPAHEIDKIFEPFYQGANGAWRDRSGSGLGLAISRQFIELHEGQIWVESSVGQGSKFSFRLPISPLAPVSASSGRWINEEWMWVERKSRPAIPQLPYRQRIILYDETGELSALFAQSYHDIEFVDTHSMAETIAMLEECPAHAVIVNVALPANLLPLLEDARLAIPDTPILGYSVPHRIDHAIASGALNYLIKPVTRADIKEMADSIGKPLRRVLIVDDDADFGRLLTRMWQTLDPDVQIVVATNGEMALALLQESPPDLMLLDIAMPNQDGWQVLAAKNQEPSMAAVPVTIVSAQDPMDYPQSSGLVVVAFGNGIPVGKLPICSLQLADLLLAPAPEPDQAPG